MINQKKIKTERLETAYLESGTNSGDLLVLLHGNVSSSEFYRLLIPTLPQSYHIVAPDMRGFGSSETAPIDATRGVKDFSDDLRAFLQKISTPGKKIHLMGWSAGGAVIMQYLMDYPGTVHSLTLQAPMSPFGFGGTKNTGLTLEACAPDFAGSGGGTTALPFVDCLRTRDGEIPSTQPEGAQCNVQSHARATMNGFYFKPVDGKTLLQRGIISKETEDAFTESMYNTKLGDDNYPGNLTPSVNWPMVAPGDRGMNNAISPKYCNLSAFVQVSSKIPVLWIRGEDDQIVSDTSFLELNYLGSLGYVPGWPGAATHPPQPMVTQMRSVLEAYKTNGGSYEEKVFKNCGHSPHIEQQTEFVNELTKFLAGIK